MAKAKTDDVVDTPVVQIPKPDLSILQRAAAHPFGLPSERVRLREPQYITKWCNTGISGNQLGKHIDLGWMKCRPEYLADVDRVAFNVSPDGYVVRGNHGEEILMYTVEAAYAQRQLEKAQRNIRGMRSETTKAEVVEAAGAQLGDQAADFLNRRGNVVGGVRDSYERVERREEVE